MAKSIISSAPSAFDPEGRAVALLHGAEIGFALSVLDSSPDCIKLIELDGTLSYMNRNGLCAMEIDDFGTVDRQPWAPMWPATMRPQLTEAVRAAAAFGRVSRIEGFCPTAKGTPRWWHVTVAPVRGQSGQVERVLATSRDVTDVVQSRQKLEEQARQLEREAAQKDLALDRQQVLMGEIDHRVKNSFAAVIGLLRMQARQAPDAAAGALSDAANRISTLARVHEQLHLDPASDRIRVLEYLGQLAADIGTALNARVTVASPSAGSIRVTPGDAAAIGQVLAELIGNAVKHAPADHVATIDIGLDHDAAQRRLILSVGDDGPGLPEGFDPETGAGLGMQICSIYASQMGEGLFHGRSELGGALFRIAFRLDEGATPV